MQARKKQTSMKQIILPYLKGQVSLFSLFLTSLFRWLILWRSTKLRLLLRGTAPSRPRPCVWENMYHKRGNFCVGVFFALLSSSRKYPHTKITAICLYEGNKHNIVKITPTCDVLPTFLRNFPPAKITTFTLSRIGESKYCVSGIFPAGKF